MRFKGMASETARIARDMVNAPYEYVKEAMVRPLAKFPVIEELAYDARPNATARRDRPPFAHARQPKCMPRHRAD